MKGMALYLLAVLSFSYLTTAVLGPPPDQVLDALGKRNYQLSLMAEQQYGMPMELRPRLIINKPLKGFDAWADCSDWTIQIDSELIKRDLRFVLDNIMPHEYAHLVRCHLTGDVGEDPHDEMWSLISSGLGGPKRNYYGRR